MVFFLVAAELLAFAPDVQRVSIIVKGLCEVRSHHRRSVDRSKSRRARITSTTRVPRRIAGTFRIPIPCISQYEAEAGPGPSCRQRYILQRIYKLSRIHQAQSGSIEYDRGHIRAIHKQQTLIHGNRRNRMTSTMPNLYFVIRTSTL